MTGFALLKAGWLALGKAGLIGMLPFIKFIAIAALVATAATLIMKNWKPIKQFFVDLFTNPLQQLKDMVSFAGHLAKKAGAFFGFGDGKDDVDRQLEAQGFKITNNQKGEALGADKITKKSNDFMVRQQKAQVDVNFSNMPKDTRVLTEDRESILNVNTGMLGAI